MSREPATSIVVPGCAAVCAATVSLAVGTVAIGQPAHIPSQTVELLVDSGTVSAGDDEYLFFVDTNSGEIVGVVDAMLDADVSGTVRGYATPGLAADSEANPPHNAELPGVQVTVLDDVVPARPPQRRDTQPERLRHLLLLSQTSLNELHCGECVIDSIATPIGVEGD